MNTIICDLQKPIKKLSERTVKEIENKFIGKGAVILYEVNEINVDSLHLITTRQNYTILFPSKIYSDTSTMQSDSRFDIEILKLVKKSESENRVGFVISLGKQICTEVFHRVHYNDTIKLVNEQVISKLLKDIKSQLSIDSVITFQVESDQLSIAKNNSDSSKKCGAEKIDLYMSYLEKAIKNYLHE